MKVLINIDGKIKNVFDGNSLGIPIIDTDIIKNVPDTFEGKELDDIRMWNSNWVMLSAEEIIAKGYAILTPEQKIVDHKIVNKTLQELFDEGIYIPPIGWIVYQNTLWDLAKLPQYKNDQIIVIDNSFNNNLSYGYFKSVTLNINVDCRRNETKNDLQNVQGLISYMTRNSIAQIDYVGYTHTSTGISEHALATKEQLNNLSYEMEDFALPLYQRKWTLENMIKMATTIEDLLKITWNMPLG